MRSITYIHKKRTNKNHGITRCRLYKMFQKRGYPFLNKCNSQANKDRWLDQVFICLCKHAFDHNIVKIVKYFLLVKCEE